jgi:hypothetical protein
MSSINTNTSLGNIIRQAEQIRVPVPTVKIVYYALQEMNRQIEGSTLPKIIPEGEAFAHPSQLLSSQTNATRRIA